MRQWFSKSIKLWVATDSWVPVNKSLIVSRSEFNGVLVNSENTSKETIDAFGLTVIFFIAFKNCCHLNTVKLLARG